MISAQIVLDSVSPAGVRLTTMQLRYPKFIHGEMMTHRVFNRSASSSRAVPVARNLAEVRSDELRASPVWWGREQRGMASGEELDDAGLHVARAYWRMAALAAADRAEEMAAHELHKSIVNRVLEPFLHINVVVTATEWDNFFGLRLDRGAQPEMRVLAEAMWEAMSISLPTPLVLGEWHLPFLGQEDLDQFEDLITAAKVSVARCARVSYLSHETGKRSTIAEDLALYDRLVGASPMHASPAEHQATPDVFNGSWQEPLKHGNLRGWVQYRKLLPGEDRAPLPEEYR